MHHIHAPRSRVSPVTNFRSPIRETLIKYNLISHLLGAFPPYHNWQVDMFLVPKIYGRRLILGVVLSMMTIDLTYLWVVAAPNARRETKDVQTLIDFYLHATSRSFGCFMGWQFFWNMKSSMHLVNLLFRLEKYFEGKIFIFKNHVHTFTSLL